MVVTYLPLFRIKIISCRVLKTACMETPVACLLAITDHGVAISLSSVAVGSIVTVGSIITIAVTG